MSTVIEEIAQQVNERSQFIIKIKEEVAKVIVGQTYMVDRLLVGLLTGGHVLIEGVPGLAKTLMVSTISKIINAKFQRIQFTPDMLPADIIGTTIFNPRDGTFTPKKGPIFANLVLADEINRAPAKAQSALLEAMQEHQVTIAEKTYPLDELFMVLATQNPIEQEGTYPLPEAQVDRFMLKLSVTYPEKSEEKKIINHMAQINPDLEVDNIIAPEEIMKTRKVVDSIYVDEKIIDYVLDIVFATRTPVDYGLDIEDLIEYGASPRASIYLILAAKAYAFLSGRAYVTPQDIKSIGMDVLRHRVIISYEAEAREMTSEDVVHKIFDEIRVP